MKILFVCTGNTCRSPMAEGICNSLLKDRGVEAVSAGLSVLYSEPPSLNAIMAAEMYGVNISKHMAHQITVGDIRHADIVLTMTNSHKTMLSAAFKEYSDKIYTLYEFAVGDTKSDIIDPFGGSAEVYEKCCDELYALISKIGERI